LVAPYRGSAPPCVRRGQGASSPASTGCTAAEDGNSAAAGSSEVLASPIGGFDACPKSGSIEADGMGSWAVSAGETGSPSAACTRPPTMRRTSASTWFAEQSSGPKPGMAFGSLKSQAFSASPTKSRMAGSALQARRSAARLNSLGTPLRRKAAMSVAASIDSIGGSSERSVSWGTGSAAASDGAGPCASAPSGAGSA